MLISESFLLPHAQDGLVVKTHSICYGCWADATVEDRLTITGHTKLTMERASQFVGQEYAERIQSKGCCRELKVEVFSTAQLTATRYDQAIILHRDPLDVFRSCVLGTEPPGQGRTTVFHREFHEKWKTFALFVRYEDMKADPVQQLPKRIFDFLGVEVPASKLACAVEQSTMDKLKEEDLSYPLHGCTKQQLSYTSVEAVSHSAAADATATTASERKAAGCNLWVAYPFHKIPVSLFAVGPSLKRCCAAAVPATLQAQLPLTTSETGSYYELVEPRQESRDGVIVPFVWMCCSDLVRPGQSSPHSCTRSRQDVDVCASQLAVAFLSTVFDSVKDQASQELVLLGDTDFAVYVGCAAIAALAAFTWRLCRRRAMKWERSAWFCCSTPRQSASIRWPAAASSSMSQMLPGELDQDALVAHSPRRCPSKGRFTPNQEPAPGPACYSPKVLPHKTKPGWSFGSAGRDWAGIRHLWPEIPAASSAAPGQYPAQVRQKRQISFPQSARKVHDIPDTPGPGQWSVDGDVGRPYHPMYSMARKQEPWLEIELPTPPGSTSLPVRAATAPSPAFGQRRSKTPTKPHTVR
ncbi:unnamed protein product, partial [Symbiodinium necroappetens]